MSHEDALKLDILMDLKKQGWGLQETDDPATLTMSVGTGYTLYASVNKPWYILFDDGIEKTEYPIESDRVPYINRKDVKTLWGKFDKRVKSLGTSELKPLFPPAKNVETPMPKKKKSTSVKNKSAKPQELPGMLLPVIYPHELEGQFMRFRQWTAKNDVIPKDSGVVILDEDEYNYRVSIPKAHISFDIPKGKAEVVQA